MIITYFLNFRANTNNLYHTYSASVDFTADAQHLIFLQGSYNGINTRGRSIFIDNSTNADEVILSAGANELTRTIPPYGQQQVTIDGFNNILLVSGNGTCNIEITDAILPEQLFQRTDSLSSFLQSPFVDANVGDLLVINVAGQLLKAIYPTVAANNTTTYFPVASGIPSVLAGNTQNSMLFGPTSTGEHILFSDMTPLRAEILSFTNYRLNNSIVANANIDSPSFIETSSHYLVKSNKNNADSTNAAIFTLDKTTLTSATLVPSGGFTFGGINTDRAGVLCDDGASGDSFIYFGINNASATDLRAVTFNASGVPQSISGSIIVPTGSFKSPGGVGVPSPSSAIRFNNGNYALSYYCPVAAARITAITLDSAFMLLNTFTSTAGQSLTTACNVAQNYKLKLVDEHTAVLPVSIAAGARLLFIKDDGTINNVLVGGALTSPDVMTYIAHGYVWCLTYETGVWVARKFDTSGAVVTTLSSAPTPSTLRMSIQFDQDFIIVANSARLIVIDTANSAIVEIASGIFANTYLVSLLVQNIASSTRNILGYTTAGNFEQKLYQMAQSIFGVLKDQTNIAVTGQFTVNQNFPGSTSFNQNAATPIGNRGVIINNVAQLNGLAP